MTVWEKILTMDQLIKKGSAIYILVNLARIFGLYYFLSSCFLSTSQVFEGAAARELEFCLLEENKGGYGACSFVCNLVHLEKLEIETF